MGAHFWLLCSQTLQYLLARMGTILNVSSFYVSFLLAPMASNASELVAEANDNVSLHLGGCCCHEQHFHYWCILCPHIHEGYCLGVPSRNYCLSPHSGCNSDDDAELEAPALDACVCSFFFL